MKKLLLFSLALNVILLIFVVFFLSRNKENIVQKLITSRQTADIVMFGDSHTARGKWTFLLKKWGIKRSGHGGFTSTQLLPFLEPDVITFKPQYCFIQMGGNDISSPDFKGEQLIKSFKIVIEKLKYNNIQPVVQSLFYRIDRPQKNPVIDSLNTKLSEFCYQHNIQFIDINSILAEKGIDQNYYKPDGIHLSKSGYKVWSKQLKSFLKKKNP